MQELLRSLSLAFLFACGCGEHLLAYSLNFLDQPAPGEMVAVFDFNSLETSVNANGSLTPKLAVLGPSPAKPAERALIVTSNREQEWAVFFKTRAGLLRAQSRYRITVQFQAITPWAEGCYAYLLVRSESPQPRWRPMQVLEGGTEEAGRLSYEFLTGAEADCTISFGIHREGSILLKSVEIEQLPLLEAVDTPLVAGTGSWNDLLGICSHLDWRHFYKTDEQITRVLDLMRPLQIGWVRLCFPWDQLFPKSAKAPDPAMLRRLEFIVNETKKRHLRLVVILIAPPAWASAGPNAETAWRYPARKLEDYEKYVRFMAREFKGRIRYWEIGNETNWNQFWMGSYEDYLKELRVASKILREVDPDNFILCAGLTDAGLHAMKGSYVGALRDLCDPINAACYDALSLHYYPRSAEEAIYAVNNVAAYMKQRGVSKPIWITETGFSVANGRTVEQQAAMLEKLIPLLAAHPDVERVFMYNDRVKDFESDAYERGFGLLEADFSPRPVYTRLQELFRTSPPNKAVGLTGK